MGINYTLQHLGLYATREGVGYFHANGRTYAVVPLDSDTPPKLFTHLDEPDPVAPIDNNDIPPLTTRQMEALMYAARGMTARQIARKMEVTSHTVTQHLAVARKLFKVKRTPQAVALARSMGMLKDLE